MARTHGSQEEVMRFWDWWWWKWLRGRVAKRPALASYWPVQPRKPRLKYLSTSFLVLNIRTSVQLTYEICEIRSFNPVYNIAHKGI
jgi:hypothetical protein